MTGFVVMWLPAHGAGGAVTAAFRSFQHGSLVPGSPIGHSGDSRVAKAADGTMRFRASAGDSADQTAVGVSPPSRTAHTHGAAAKADTVVIDTQGDHRSIDRGTAIATQCYFSGQFLSR